MKRAAQILINSDINLTGLEVCKVNHIEEIEPSQAGCPKDCPNIDQLSCYWSREIKLSGVAKYPDSYYSSTEVNYVLACLKGGQMRLLDTDYLIEINKERELDKELMKTFERWMKNGQQSTNCFWNINCINAIATS